MGGSLKVWREKNVLKSAPGKRRCNCKNEVYRKEIGPGMFQQMIEQVFEQCPNVKYEREGYFITVDVEKGMQDGQEVVFYEDCETIIDGEAGDLKLPTGEGGGDIENLETILVMEVAIEVLMILTSMTLMTLYVSLVIIC